MKVWISRVLGMCALAAWAGAAGAIELKNDGFGTGAQVRYQGGFTTGEIAAVRLTPPAGGAAINLLGSVRFLFGGSTSTEGITLYVWDDSAGTVQPGALLYHADYELMGQDDAQQTIDLLGEGISVTGPIRVGIQVFHDSYPGVAVDSDGNTTPNANFILTGEDIFADASTGTWHVAGDLGLTGDFIIRADVMPFGAVDAGVRDAGRDGSVDAGVADAGNSDDDDDGGCGCKTGVRDPNPSAAAVTAGVLFLIAALAMGRRR